LVKVVRFPRPPVTETCCGVPDVAVGVVWSYEYNVEDLTLQFNS